jgi:hypothetical protein
MGPITYLALAPISKRTQLIFGYKPAQGKNTHKPDEPQFILGCQSILHLLFIMGLLSLQSISEPICTSNIVVLWLNNFPL